jgi:hypothetical protein
VQPVQLRLVHDELTLGHVEGRRPPTSFVGPLAV